MDERKTKHCKSNLIRKWTTDMERHVTAEDIQMANKHMKRYSNLLTDKEKQIKITMGCHCTPIRMAKIKSSNNTKCWQGYEWYNKSGKQFGSFLKH